MPCDDPTTAAELFALVERADHAIAADDPSAFTKAWGEANRAVVCL